MKLDSASPLTEADLNDAEQHVFRDESLLARIAERLIDEVRRLRHELNDPRYMYAGSRIHRNAILCRNSRGSDGNET